MEKMKIKCPICSAVLMVTYHEGLESKAVKCPICSKNTPFANYKKIVDKEERTIYRDKTHNETVGQLRLTTGNASPIKLKLGKNVIGRKVTMESQATVQIPTEGSKRMSREHMIIEVKYIPGKGVVHYASLYKEKVNATYINDMLLEYGDCVIVNNGDLIRLPDVIVKFEILDDEGTDLTI